MPAPKKSHVSKRSVLGAWVSLLLAIPSLAQSQTASPEIRPSPQQEASPAASATPLIPQTEEKNPSQPSPTASPAESTTQPIPPALPGESPSPAQPAAAPVSPLIPPSAGPGALPAPSPKPTLAPQTVQALDEQYQQSLRIQRVHPKDLLFISLMDAVRMALYQNPEVRLAVEDAQLAKGSLVKTTGEFDSKLFGVTGYGKSFTGPAEGNAATPNQIRQQINQSLNGVFGTLAANPSAINNIGNVINQSTSAAAKNNIAKSITVLFAAFDVSKRLRNGATVDLEYAPDVLDENDQPTWPPVKHNLKISVSIPLTKLGKIANDADEMAAQIDYEASLLNPSHAATKAALDTVNAYWKASAALEKFYVSDRAYRISDALLSLTQELVKGDAIPASELSLSEARRAEALTNRSTALLAVFTAGGELAKTLGIRSEQLKKLPLAYESFPTIPLAALDTENLTELGLYRRFDRAAALKGIQSKRLLAEKARIDLRPDLKFKAGAGLSIVDNAATNGRGGYSVEPTWELGLGFDYPPANHAKKGALISAQADLDKSILSMETVSRSIASDILPIA